MYAVTKRFKFEGAHVLDSSYSVECQNIHGHSYTVDVTLVSNKLNPDGMVIDFKKLKKLINPIFDELDHALLVYNKTFCKILEKAPGFLELGWNIKTMNSNPTAENMAKEFFDKIDMAFIEYPDITVGLVEVSETLTGKASYCRY